MSGLCVGQRMKQRKISHADLAAALQMDDGEVNALIAGELEITETMAEALCCILGGTVKDWRDEWNE